MLHQANTMMPTPQLAAGLIPLVACLLMACGSNNDRTIPSPTSPDSFHKTLPTAQLALNASQGQTIVLEDAGTRRSVSQAFQHTASDEQTIQFAFPQANHFDCPGRNQVRTGAYVQNEDARLYDLDTAGDQFTFDPGEYLIVVTVYNHGRCQIISQSIFASTRQ